MTTGVLPCPHCNRSDPKQITFSWWGGVLGPKLLHHVRCLQCGKTYNGKTGRSNNMAIGVYMAITLVITIGLLLLLLKAQFSGP